MDRFRTFRIAMAAILPALIFILLPGATALAGTIKGTILDANTGEPISYATVRDDISGQSISANKDGEYRLRLRRGSYELKFSHLAYYSEKLAVEIPDTAVLYDIRLKPSRIEVPGITVSARAYGPGQRIILEAIKRKAEILSRIQSYTFEAYTKMVIREEGKDDSTSIAFINESQQKSYWEQPGKYKTIVNAQRHSQNVKGVEGTGALNGLLDFNQNRLDLQGNSVVAPAAEDALDFYNYYLLDTIFVDNRPVFRLEIEPKSALHPLFAGEILIADSTYDVVGVDVEFSEAFDWQYLKNPRFSQKYELFRDSFWMPIEIRFEIDIELGIPGISNYFIDYVVALHKYDINLVHDKDIFDDYVLEVAENALEVDSATWNEGQMIPLTHEEIGGYELIDSIAQAPMPFKKRLLSLSFGAMYIASAAPDFFHFNRVEGTYLGAAVNLRDILPRTDLAIKSGYAITGEYWQHDYGIVTELHERRRLKFGARYHDKIVHRLTIVSGPDANPTVAAATTKSDPFDYFHETGFDLTLSSKLLRKTTATVGYHDYNQHSVTKNTEFAVFEQEKKHRDNPAIVDGKLRSLTAEVGWDSRNLMKFGRRVYREPAASYSTLQAGMEVASPDLVGNDFDFRRYYARFYRTQSTLGFGFSSLSLYTGASDGDLPPQKHFTVDYGAGLLTSDIYFKTLGEKNFSGNRAAAVYATHDFGRRLFIASGIPLIRDIPFSVGVFGGAFWTDFKNHKYQPGDNLILFSPKAYSEIGFQIRRISPLNFTVDFTWRLSDHNTEKFSLDIGMAFIE
ncbi:MAG: DUF5686 and carboxypeptidase regulatory-like domain-containing protein [candidate division Zixibacteria bacterium]|nr:DUF5686 and carboxypeptidase regulatory-like domain-containing protein [candidate division Zixibacteria bacterium]MBU1469250.1 DUF5686 and carboxypeptidase regulatory-like domain-containing protein [candidate division Zixibacteria bacterium]MBU2626741.1 DUF5686 and carboxypeptidase regulatory-like domain-containing protein [candidate division Zixibacteria bacterium]